MNYQRESSNLVSWNTKFYILLAVLLGAFTLSSSGDEISLAVGAFIALFILLVVDLLEVVSHRYHGAWRVVKIGFAILLTLLILIG